MCEPLDVAMLLRAFFVRHATEVGGGGRCLLGEPGSELRKGASVEKKDEENR